MMSLVSQIIWSKPGPGGRNVLDYGLIQRPKDVRVGNYKDEYADFITHVNSLLTDGRVSAPS